jgi:hypothetical protein
MTIVCPGHGRQGKKKALAAGMLYWKEPKLSGFTTSSLPRDSPHTAPFVSGDPSLWNVNSSRACTTAWHPPGSGDPQILVLAASIP